MSEALTVTVMCGGPSEEREISLRSGRAVVQALRSLNYKVFELDPADLDWTLPEGTDVVFLALHGTYGEDGEVQRRLEELGVPYTGSGPEASRIGFNKLETKRRCEAAGLPTPPYAVLPLEARSWPSGWEPPVVLKPIVQGSSIGLRFVNRPEELPEAMAESGRFGCPMLMEAFVRGREMTVGILDDRPLPVTEVRPRDGRYDYDHKYTPGGAEYLCPAPLPPKTARRVQEAALGVFRAVGARDFARVDIMLAEDGTPYVLEINTLPGMTELSLLPKAAAQAGYSFAELCRKMVEMAWARRKR